MNQFFAISLTAMMAFFALVAICKIKNPIDGISTIIAIGITKGYPIFIVWYFYAQI
jgi:hypothetical protein